MSLIEAGFGAHTVCLLTNAKARRPLTREEHLTMFLVAGELGRHLPYGDRFRSSQISGFHC